MIGLKRGTVALSEHQASWAEWYEQERARLLIMGDSVGPFEHIGSTAIPGIPSKPIIDFMGHIYAGSVQPLLLNRH